MGHSFVHFGGRSVRLNDTSLEIAWGFILPHFERLAAAGWPAERLPEVARLRDACAYIAPGCNRVDLGEFLRDARARQTMSEAIAAAKQEVLGFGLSIPGHVVAAQQPASGLIPAEHVPAASIVNAIGFIGDLLRNSMLRPSIAPNGGYAVETSPGLELLAGYVMCDVQGSLEVCDEVIAATSRALGEKSARHEDAGNAYTVEITRDRTIIRSQFNEQEHVELPTSDFLAALHDWRHFLEEQRHLRARAHS